MINGDCESDTAWEMPITAVTAAYSTTQAHSPYRSIRAGIIGGVNKYSLLLGPAAGGPARHDRHGHAQLLALPGLDRDTAGGLCAGGAGSSSPGPAAAVPLAGDAQYVLLMDDDDHILRRLVWMREDTQAWTYYTFDVSQYRGQAIWLHFGVYNDGAGGITGMYVDDVSLAACEQEGRISHLPAPGRSTTGRHPIPRLAHCDRRRAGLAADSATR